MKNAIKNTICILLLACSKTIFAQTASSEQMAAEFIRKTEMYANESAQMNSAEVYEEIERIRKVMIIKNQSTPNYDLSSDDLTKSSGYLQTLEKRRNSQEPSASFYWGVFNFRICAIIDSAKGETQDCWAKVIDSFKVASKSGISAASFNIGKIYERGFGVAPSKMIAADWYVKSAEQAHKNDERDNSLQALEAAINASPDLPAIKRLKAQILK